MRKHLTQIIIITTAILVVFLNTLNNGFKLDDNYRVYNNPGIETSTPLWRHFVDPGTMSTLPRIEQYRPFLPFTLAINYRLHRYSLPGYHIFNMIFHMIAAILVYFLILELITHWINSDFDRKKRQFIALIASLLFALHPVSGILINYVCSRDLILMQMFLTGSFLAYVRMRRLGITFLRLSAVISLFICSMFSKTNGVAAPALVLVFEFLLAKKEIKDLSTWWGVDEPLCFSHPCPDPFQSCLCTYDKKRIWQSH